MTNYLGKMLFYQYIINNYLKKLKLIYLNKVSLFNIIILFISFNSICAVSYMLIFCNNLNASKC